MMMLETLMAVEALSQVDQRLASAFRGTIIATYADGRTTELWLDPAGTYRALNRKRSPSSGKWSMKGDRVCLKQQKPFWVPFSYCTAIPIATTWTARAAVTGEAVQVKLVDDGRKDLVAGGE